MKKRLYHDLAKRGPGRASSEQNISLPNGMGFRWFEERFSSRHSDRIGSARRREGSCGLELATGHYRGRDLVEKVRAALSIYAHAEDASKFRPVLDQRELTEILSL